MAHFAPHIKDSIAGLRSRSRFIRRMAEKLDKIPEFGYDKDAKALMTFLESIKCNDVPLFKEFPDSRNEIDEFLSSTHYLPATDLMEKMGLIFGDDHELNLENFNQFKSSIDGLLEFVKIPDYSDLLVYIKESLDLTKSLTTQVDSYSS